MLFRAHIANHIHAQFKEDPDAWLMVDEILSKATHDQTKCLCPSTVPIPSVRLLTNDSPGPPSLG